MTSAYRKITSKEGLLKTVRSGRTRVWIPVKAAMGMVNKVKDTLLLSHVVINSYKPSICIMCEPLYSIHRIPLQRSLHTPIFLPQSYCTIEFLDNGYIYRAALELHSRAAPSLEASLLSRSWHREKYRKRAEQEKKSSFKNLPELHFLALH